MWRTPEHSRLNKFSFLFIHATGHFEFTVLDYNLLAMEVHVVFFFKSAYEPNWLIRPELIPVSVALSD